MNEKPNGLLSYINGENALEQAPDNLKQSARDYLQGNPLPPDIESISQDQAEVYSFLHNEFIKDYPVIDEHVLWHQNNGSGGTRGEGSGEEFMRFHRRMMEDLSEYIDQEIPLWTEFQPDIANLMPLATGVELNPANFPVQVPSFLTNDGGSEEFTLSTSQGFKAIQGFENIDSIDELGQIIGTSIHGDGHALLGGTMLDLDSPRAPQFYSWHGALDNIADNYLASEKGLEWLNSPAADNWKADELASQGRDFNGIATPAVDNNEQRERTTIAAAGGGAAALLLVGAAAAYGYKRAKKSWANNVLAERESNSRDIEQGQQIDNSGSTRSR